MSRIIFDDNYVIVQPSFSEVTPHKHTFYHIFFLFENKQCRELYIVGSNMIHTMPSREKCRLFLIIDPTSTLAEYLDENFLEVGKPQMIPCTDCIL